MRVEASRRLQDGSPKQPDSDQFVVSRAYEASKLGLSEDASWEEIYRGWDEQLRVELAKQLGIDVDSEMATDCPNYAPWGVILKKLLDMGGRGSLDVYNVKEILQRVKEIRQELKISSRMTYK